MAEREENELKFNLKVGDSRPVRITDCQPFGLLVSVDGTCEGIIERIGLAKAGYSMDEFHVGMLVDALVIGFREWSSQIEFTLPLKSDV